MKVTFKSSGGFDNMEKWLKETSNKVPKKSLADIAKKGVDSLSKNTPRDTGATAQGWVAEIESNGHIHEVAWKNTAHPNTQANVAVLIEDGHGTRTGGYVPPRPYIKQSMDGVFDQAADKIAEELTK